MALEIYIFSSGPVYLLFTFLSWATGSQLCCKSPAYQPQNPQSILSHPSESNCVHSLLAPILHLSCFLKKYNLITKPIHHRKDFSCPLWTHIWVWTRTQILSVLLAFDFSVEHSCSSKDGSAKFSAVPLITVLWQIVAMPHNAVLWFLWPDNIYRII